MLVHEMPHRTPPADHAWLTETQLPINPPTNYQIYSLRDARSTTFERERPGYHAEQMLLRTADRALAVHDSVVLPVRHSIERAYQAVSHAAETTGSHMKSMLGAAAINGAETLGVLVGKGKRMLERVGRGVRRTAEAIPYSKVAIGVGATAMLGVGAQTGNIVAKTNTIVEAAFHGIAKQSTESVSDPTNLIFGTGAAVSAAMLAILVGGASRVHTQEQADVQGSILSNFE